MKTMSFYDVFKACQHPDPFFDALANQRQTAILRNEMNEGFRNDPDPSDKRQCIRNQRIVLYLQIVADKEAKEAKDKVGSQQMMRGEHSQRRTGHSFLDRILARLFLSPPI
jgi:hypothetical protein